MTTENDALIEVTIETTTTETARIRIDWAEFWDWAGDVRPGDLNAKVEEFLRAGDEWEVCAQVHEASRATADVVDCEVRSVRTFPPGPTEPRDG